MLLARRSERAKWGDAAGGPDPADGSAALALQETLAVFGFLGEHLRQFDIAEDLRRYREIDRGRDPRDIKPPKPPAYPRSLLGAGLMGGCPNVNVLPHVLQPCGGESPSI